MLPLIRKSHPAFQERIKGPYFFIMHPHEVPECLVPDKWRSFAFTTLFVGTASSFSYPDGSHLLMLADKKGQQRGEILPDHFWLGTQQSPGDSLIVENQSTEACFLGSQPTCLV